MQVEALADAMEWRRGVHANMARCLEHCSAGSKRERVRMLLDYLSRHERELDHVLPVVGRGCLEAGVEYLVL